MKPKMIIIASCSLVLVAGLAYAFVANQNQDNDETVDQEQTEQRSEDSSEEQDDKDVAKTEDLSEPLTSPLSNKDEDDSTEQDDDLSAGGCPENLGKIVFSYDPRDRETVHYGIYVMDADGSNRVRISGVDEIHHTHPAWSPDRCRIAFRSYTKEGDDDIYVMDADGTNIKQLTTDPARDMFPDWSSDGTEIVFVSYRDEGIRNLYVMDADGSHQRQLTTNPEEYTQWERWSPIGDEIAYIFHPKEDEPNKGGVIYIINSDGSDVRQLTPDAGSLGDTDLTWSPDGQKMYFISNRSHYVEIWEIEVDGTDMRQITDDDSVDITHSLRVSPDGTKLAFYGVGPDVGEHSEEIYTINVDGTGLTDITLSPGQEEWLDW
jgi:Tol biopolymer transport system component